MAKAARWFEIAVGLFFLISATAKALDLSGFGVQISAYNIIKNPETVRRVSFVALAVEAALGTYLVGGQRFGGITHLVSATMILVYSSLIAYAWAFHGLKDCGCLGTWVSMGPAASLAKNIALLGAIGFAWLGGHNFSQNKADLKNNARARLVAMSLFAAVGFVAAIAIPLNDARRPQVPAQENELKPYAQFVFDADGQHFDLGKGEHLVAMLNATCEHCRASVPGLNKLIETPGLPPMIALMMGSEEELADFRAKTSPLFSAHLIEPLTFMEFIGTTPPWLSHIRDGVGVRHWDWEDEVPAAEILAYFKKPGE